MVWSKISLLLLLFLLLFLAPGVDSSGRQFAAEEDIFDTIMEKASNYYIMVKLYLESFFETVGFKRRTDEWKFVREFMEVLRGRTTLKEGSDEEDPIEKVLYGELKPNVSLPPAMRNKTASCKLCLGLVTALRVAVKKTNYSFVEKQVIRACNSVLAFSGMRASVLCKGTISLMGPHVNYIVTQPIFLVPKICPYMNACTSSDDTSLLEDLKKEEEEEAKREEERENGQAQGRTKAEERTETKERPAMELPKADEPEVLESKEADKVEIDAGQEKSVLKIVQLTDMHFEKRYKNGTATYCGLPVCCIEEWGRGEAGHYGDYKCNIPEKTVENFLEKVKALNPDAVLFTGDVSPHTIWEENLHSQLQCTEKAAKMFQKTLSGRKIYPIIGNHETHPTSLFSVGELMETKEFLKVFQASWKEVANFTNDDLKNIAKGGFYTKLIKEGLRVVAFNSGYMYTFNFYNVINHEKLFRPEARDTLRFLESSLQSAGELKEKVILLFHHPPGGADFIVSQSVWLEKLMLKYKDTIVLTVNGHTHNDEFRIVYDGAGKPASVIFVAPSLTTYGTINPSMRVYHLDAKTFQPLDYEQYHLDIEELSRLKREDLDSYDITAHIKKSYTARSEYGLKDLSAASLHELTKKMEDDPKTLLKFLNHYSAEAVKVDEAGRVLKRIHVCRLRNVHHDKVKACTFENDLLPIEKEKGEGSSGLFGIF